VSGLKNAYLQIRHHGLLQNLNRILLNKNTMITKLSDYTLQDILPHRGTMLLIDDIIEVDDIHAVTTSVITASYPLTDSNGVQPLIMVELAAQTAGVCNGLERIKDQGAESSKMGWLVGIKRAQFYIDCLPFGSTVLTRSENVHNYDKLREVSAVLYMEEILIGEITLQLYQV
jgi:predicted hotdog family 3-hydroxylacyl-ACP dehydratase